MIVIEVKKLIKSDLFRYYANQKPNFVRRTQLYGFKYTKILRKAHYYKKHNKIMFMLYGYLLNRLQLKYGYQISISATIGRGLYLCHLGTVIVNPDVVIGDNVNLNHNITIGQTNRGTNKGAPIIGNKVWIGTGAVIVGKIQIGDDVLIAPNSYVNVDVPPHSVVVGNPAVIHHRENATQGYIENTIK